MKPALEHYVEHCGTCVGGQHEKPDTKGLCGCCGHDLMYRPPEAVEQTKLKTGGRSDWRVPAAHSTAIEAFGSTDVVTHLRRFFDALDAEAEQRKDDPIAMTHALARMDALLADVRFVRDTIRDNAAHAMKEQSIRRLVVEKCATVEATNSAVRSDWQDETLLRRVLSVLLNEEECRWLEAESGEFLDVPALAHNVLQFFRPQWRLTPLKDHRIDPDEYSTIDKDENGKPIRTPGVRTIDNHIRRAK